MNPPVHLLAASEGSTAALLTFLIYTLAVFALAAFSNQLLKHKSFLSEYFLGSRSLGVWAFALTFAATSSSGGSFTGFPSLIYSHGWILALWIGSYMVVPICTMGLIGKRLNQVARISGAITVPDVVRDRFGSRRFGLLATLLIIFFMSFNLVAQFKAGSVILRTLLADVESFQVGVDTFAPYLAGIPFLDGVAPEYLLCLLTFGAAVIIYTTYGGFHAVVWTDVMQGIVMVIGVLILLPLAISQAGGMASATRELAELIPPYRGSGTLQLRSGDSGDSEEDRTLRSGTWISGLPESSESDRLFRVVTTSLFPDDSGQLEDVDLLEIRSPSEKERVRTDPEHFPYRDDVVVIASNMTPPAYPQDPDQPGAYVSGPGPSVTNDDGFLPLSLAISFFFMWAISGTGQPSNMVRLMAFNSSRTLRRSIFTVAIYYSMIYFPLVIIFCCARVLLPGMDAESDRIMPAMAVFLTENIGAGWLAGLLVAAPFAAVMSTVDSFLLMISSALVRDMYQRNINPDASERTIKRLSFLFTLLVGTCAMIGAINPPEFLQKIIVYTGSGLAACFLAPVIFALYWPRLNTTGAMGGMLCGFVAHLSMYCMGIIENGSFFQPYRLFNFDPIIVGLIVSFSTTWLLTMFTPPPDPTLVRRYFYRGA